MSDQTETMNIKKNPDSFDVDHEIESPDKMPENLTPGEATRFDAAPATLYVVGTPIGNLGDFSPRGRAVCAAVDLIAAEDTRVSGRMLRKLGIHTPLISFHEHNTHERVAELLPRIRGGLSLGLVSDAGMPSVSDPGVELVRACRDAGLNVEVIPGPTALITALAGSGLDSGRFYFEGFLPTKGKERAERLALLSGRSDTVILYEAPHRLIKTLDDLTAAGLGERTVAVARELTKRYEEYRICTVARAGEYYRANTPRGEFVLVIEDESLRSGDETGRSNVKDLGPARAGEDIPGDGLSPCQPSESDRRNYDIELGGRIMFWLIQGHSVKDIVTRIMEDENKIKTSKNLSLTRNNLYNLIQKMKRWLQGELH